MGGKGGVVVKAQTTFHRIHIVDTGSPRLAAMHFFIFNMSHNLRLYILNIPTTFSQMQELEDISKYSVEIGHIAIYSGMLRRVSYDEWSYLGTQLISARHGDRSQCFPYLTLKALADTAKHLGIT